MSFCQCTCFILFICLFGVLRRFQHCTGHITTGSWKGRGNQYIEFARVVYCKLPTNGKQLPAFPLTAMTGIEPRPQRWEARVLPLCHRGPLHMFQRKYLTSIIKAMIHSCSHQFFELMFGINIEKMLPCKVLNNSSVNQTLHVF